MMFHFLGKKRQSRIQTMANGVQRGGWKQREGFNAGGRMIKKSHDHQITLKPLRKA
jgi:hypothetical protein